MRVRAAVLAIALAIATAATVNGQASPIYGFIDYPAEGATMRQSEVMFAGWAFNCNQAGQQPYGLKVMRAAVGSPPAEVTMYRYSGLSRPDVQAAFNGYCGAMSEFTGWTLVPFHPLPLGTQTLWFEFSDSTGVLYLSRTITVVP